MWLTSTASPLYMRWTSRISIFYRCRMFKEHGGSAKRIGRFVLSGLISDTLLLKSPTTPSDKVVHQNWQKLAGINGKYGTMLKSWYQQRSKSAERIVPGTFEWTKRSCSSEPQLILRSFGTPSWEIEAAIQRQCNNSYSDFVLMITDIVNSNSKNSCPWLLIWTR